MAAVADAVARILAAYEPYGGGQSSDPLELVDANRAVALLTAGCAAALLEPPQRAAALPASRRPRPAHPDAGVVARTCSPGCATRSPRPVTRSCRSCSTRLRAYPAPGRPAPHAAPVVPIRLAAPDGRELAFLSTTTLFGTPGDVTVDERRSRPSCPRTTPRHSTDAAAPPITA
jgi:hypothetical protein